ncbi:alkaline phosphatase family protein [Lihuaxuella thermophila]|uniref:Type I phosphodiesterase / nucleotide pyrophosphatase n=1 Tax=Lihuaxuella thermophila TaxID=1173111 RepID=A0A1H8D0P2_9BACL|nr:alkaline phosphatase family protein [Lihuaxuella thermophila]SEN00188.1 Type I phosphodiesterase / nucleotide pyrophosphatase [Lihuaxuella thermophila]
MKSMKSVLIVATVVLVVIGISLFFNQKKPDKPSAFASRPTRPVVMIVIDSLMDAPLQEAMKLGRAPALKFLSEKGHYYPRVVSSFPTMSVSIDSTLLTGAYPNDHKIFGLSYFHKELNRIVNFGTGLGETFRVGLKDVLRDGLQNLNQHFLGKDVQTIHEATGQPTASLNAVIYRGKKKHTLQTPWLAVVTGILPRKIETMGPEFLSFGSLSKIDSGNGHDHVWNRYGINDTFSRQELVSLIRQNRLPAFTIAYFPKNDEIIHKKGANVIEGIEKADQELQQLLHAFSSWEDAANQITWIVLGDSGQTNLIKEKRQAYIDVRKVLDKYAIMPLKQKKPRAKDQIVLCVNERMAYIYLVDPQLSMDEVVHKLRQHRLLDVIAWKEKGWIHVASGQHKGTFRFRQGGHEQDEYRQSWELEGDLSVLDLNRADDKKIEYGVYPDVLARLSGVMETADRVIVITCAPGYEMIGESSPTHKGAAHGSLHYLDSYVPMIVSGTDSKPEHLRYVDLKQWILELISPRPL